MSYTKDLLEGGYGVITGKHKSLARIIKAKGLSFEEAGKYCDNYSKYNNFTYRDIDKAIAIATR